MIMKMALQQYRGSILSRSNKEIRVKLAALCLVLWLFIDDDNTNDNSNDYNNTTDGYNNDNNHDNFYDWHW